MMRTDRIELEDVTLSCLVSGEGPLVICAHGFPDEPGTFRAQIEALAGAGYRVVAPTMRGYAPSGLGRSGRYDAAALGDDLLGLADHFSPGAPVRIVGHDWGAIAAFSAAVKGKDRIAQLVTMAVPHALALLPHAKSPAQMRRSWYIGLFQLPVVAELRLRANDLALVDRLFRDWSPGYDATDAELRAIKKAIRPRIDAVLAYYRSLRSPSGWLGEARERLFAPVEVPTMHIHGAEDGCIGIECCEGAETHHRAGYVFHALPGAGHFVTRERPAEVSALLLEFFRTGPHAPAPREPQGAGPRRG